MTIAELVEFLKPMPQDAVVCVDEDGHNVIAEHVDLEQEKRVVIW